MSATKFHTHTKQEAKLEEFFIGYYAAFVPILLYLHSIPVPSTACQAVRKYSGTRLW